ncbi:hypothetical protein ElyMa_003169400 [Elysia marginata]|uniref:Uncharacterized protein n=1 Tax=Elysia marginata TaxID=1093978 RepID=A0AAV4IX46_9GAST|nr:hypothetical protein ElyMa_003169400 [Elysia marginata]
MTAHSAPTKELVVRGPGSFRHCRLAWPGRDCHTVTLGVTHTHRGGAGGAAEKATEELCEECVYLSVWCSVHTVCLCARPPSPALLCPAPWCCTMSRVVTCRLPGRNNTTTTGHWSHGQTLAPLHSPS